jgi:hypothetical protein
MLEKAIEKLKPLDQELYHIERDKIYEKFIKEVAEGKITKKEMIEKAKIIKEKILDYNVSVWYA